MAAQFGGAIWGRNEVHDSRAQLGGAMRGRDSGAQFGGAMRGRDQVARFGGAIAERDCGARDWRGATIAWRDNREAIHC